MLNTKVYKTVHSLAKLLMQSVHEKDEQAFAQHLKKLHALCLEHEATEKDHPVQWETLADFSDDFDEALGFYDKALAQATAINAKDYMASILYAKACLHIQLQQIPLALDELKQAKTAANKLDDHELKQEIAALLAEYQA